MTRLRADLTLLFVACIWGAAFVAQKIANDSMGPLSFIGVRFVLSWIAIAPFALLEHRRSGHKLLPVDWRLAGILGHCLFAGSSLQQVGLLTTTATNAGFLTALYVVFVPAVLWAMTGQPPRALVVAASLLAIAGAWLMTAKGALQQFAIGDVLILISDVTWAFWITLVPVFMARANRPFFLAFVQFGATAILGALAGLMFETVSIDAMAQALPAILYAGLLSGGLAYTLQIIAQRHTPPAEAALVMSLECVFAAIAGAVLLSERLTAPALLGAALILLGVILVEAGPIAQNLRLPAKGRDLL